MDKDSPNGSVDNDNEAANTVEVQDDEFSCSFHNQIERETSTKR